MKVATPHGWTRWVFPEANGYLFQCCDCGLVHEMKFAVAFEGKRSGGSFDYKLITDKNFRALFKARRYPIKKKKS